MTLKSLQRQSFANEPFRIASVIILQSKEFVMKILRSIIEKVQRV